MFLSLCMVIFRWVLFGIRVERSTGDWNNLTVFSTELGWQSCLCDIHFILALSYGPTTSLSF